MTGKSLVEAQNNSTVASKFANRIKLIESARAAAGKPAMSAYEKNYVGQLFENVRKGNLYKEGYTQVSNVAGIRKDLFNMTTLAVQNRVLPEVVSVQAMSSALQYLPVLEFKAGETKGQVKEGAILNSGIGLQDVQDTFYDSKYIVNEVLAPAGTTGSVNIVISRLPINAGTIKIVEGTNVATDDGNGNITGAFTGTIDYTTGTGNITVSGTATEDIKISYTYANEEIRNGDKGPAKVTIGITPVEMKAEEHQLQAVYALSAAYRLDKEFGVSMPLVFEQQVANEMNKEQERLVFSDMFNNAQGGAAVVWSSTPRPGVSDKDHIDSLPIAVNLASAKIYQATGGNLGASFILAGSNAGAYFAKTTGFNAENMPLNGGSFYLGKMGNLDVFQVPSLAPNDFLIGAKGNEYYNAGYVVGDYMPITYTAPVSLADLSTQQGWLSIYANKIVNAKLYIRGRITV